MTEFPDRPDHPDFWRLSQVVIDHDKRADDNPNPETITEVLAENGIDFASLMYMARQRALRVTGRRDNATPTETMLIVLYLDAFLTGVGYQRKRIDPADLLAIHEGLTTGALMTQANLSFDRVLEALGTDRSFRGHEQAP